MHSPRYQYNKQNYGTKFHIRYITYLLHRCCTQTFVSMTTVGSARTQSPRRSATDWTRVASIFKNKHSFFEKQLTNDQFLELKRYFQCVQFLPCGVQCYGSARCWVMAEDAKCGGGTVSSRKVAFFLLYTYGRAFPPAANRTLFLFLKILRDNVSKY